MNFAGYRPPFVLLAISSAHGVPFGNQTWLGKWWKGGFNGKIEGFVSMWFIYLFIYIYILFIFIYTHLHIFVYIYLVYLPVIYLGSRDWPAIPPLRDWPSAHLAPHRCQGSTTSASRPCAGAQRTRPVVTGPGDWALVDRSHFFVASWE